MTDFQHGEMDTRKKTAVVTSYLEYGDGKKIEAKDVLDVQSGDPVLGC